MRTDERDIPFARMRYLPGSREYQDYYKRHPERESFDAMLRAMPPLGDVATPTHNPFVTPVVDGLFTLIAQWHPLTDVPATCAPTKDTPETFTKWAKGLTLELGASAVRTHTLTSEHYYSHKARPMERYGEPITDMLPHGIVFSIPMNPKLIAHAPKAPEMVATVLAYLEGAKIALALASAIGAMGYRARAHIDGSYFMPLRKLALDSGLGVIGRNGLILTEDHGPCIRLAAVDTNMPLLSDAADLRQNAVRAFCELCGNCTHVCPAIPKGVWQGEFPNPDLCFQLWRKLGTDCGTCIRVCPLMDGMDWQRLKDAQGRQQLIEEIRSKEQPLRVVSEEGLWCARKC